MTRLDDIKPGWTPEPPEPPKRPAFWPSRCAHFSKELLLFALVSGFIVQTLLVYTDFNDTVPLTAMELTGRQVWHANNCQTCHQLHGFGGFLGPDLTNAVTRVERSQLDTLLTLGVDQMPAFHLDQPQIDAVWAYLGAMNKTGIGQARNPRLVREMELDEDAPPATASTPAEALMQVILEAGDESAAAGFSLFRSRSCLSCHVLFSRSSVGAPDLSLSGHRLEPGELMTVLTQGRLPKMPKPALSAGERQSVFAFIRFMAEHRADTLSRVVEAPAPFWSSLPWWEYE